MLSAAALTGPPIGAGWLMAFAAGAAGTWLIHERLRRAFDPTVALIATVLAFAGTSVYWVTVRGPAPADTAAYAAAALFLLAWDRRRGETPGSSLAAAAALASLPLLVRFVAGGTATDAARALHAPATAALFSSSHGLFTLTPVVYVAAAGVVGWLWGQPWRLAATLGVLAVWTAVSAYWPPPTGGQPFGHGLTAVVALTAPGLAWIVDRARARPVLAVAPLIAGAVAWNYWLMVQYTVGTVPKDAPVSFAVLVRQQADVATRAPYVYPWTVPASLWFAWRERLPAARYELLAHEPRRAAIDWIMDRQIERFLLEGWDAPGADGERPVYWLGGRRATITVPLDLPADRPIEIAITARARLEEPAVAARLGLEVNGREVGRFAVPPSAPTDVRLVVPAGVGGTWRAGYNRLTFVSYGVERLDPSDPRPPGPLASREGERAWPVAVYRLAVSAR